MEMENGIVKCFEWSDCVYFSLAWTGTCACWISIQIEGVEERVAKHRMGEHVGSERRKVILYYAYLDQE